MVNKVDISVAAYAERTAQRRLEGAMGARVAVRHKPHGVLAVLGPYNFPAHLPNGHIVPALLAGNAVVFKPSEKTPAVGEYLVDALSRGGRARGRRPLRPGRARDRQGARRPCRASTACCSPARPAPASRSTASSPRRRTRSSRSKWAATTRSSSGTRKDIHAAAAIAVQSAYLSAGQRCTAARRLIVEDGKHEELVDDDRQADRPADRRPSARQPGAVHGPGDRQCRRRPSPGRLPRPDRQGRPRDPPARPQVDDRPFLTPALIDVTDVERRPDAEIVRPGAADRSGSPISTPPSPRPTPPATASPPAWSAAAPSFTTASGPMSAPA